MIGAMDLHSNGRRPLLVSQASPKEGPVQADLAKRIGFDQHRFEGRASERWRPPYEPSSRARSVLFIGYGTVVASTLMNGQAPAELIIPENGLISINPPLTRRHIGSLGTRTTHPHFIASLQRVLDAVGLGVFLVDPYGGKTKGEMLRDCRDRTIVQLAATSYSCGKGKRLNQHCGRCVSCLIRRASFHAAAVVDQTSYWAHDLSKHAGSEDVTATAAASFAQRDVGRWAAEAGPLPHAQADRSVYQEVVRRGLEELGRLFGTIRWP